MNHLTHTTQLVRIHSERSHDMTIQLDDFDTQLQCEDSEWLGDIDQPCPLDLTPCCGCGVVTDDGGDAYCDNCGEIIDCMG
mgnify:FL=1|jgi:hypothetical protein